MYVTHAHSCKTTYLRMDIYQMLAESMQRDHNTCMQWLLLNTGKSAIPDIYGQCRRVRSTFGQVVYTYQATFIYVTTDVLHF